jgi:DNA-3-methyladenine glycosylase I
MRIQDEFGSFNDYIWGFTGGKQLMRETEDVPTQNELSDKVTADLKKRGFKFIGSVTIYSYLQAIGIINDHDKGCAFR